MEALPPLLPLPGGGVPRPIAVVAAAVPPLLGADRAVVAGPPHLLRVGGADPPLHQRIQVSAALPQAHARARHGAAAAAEDAAERRRRLRRDRGGAGDPLPGAAGELLWQVQEELGAAFWFFDLHLWIHDYFLRCHALLLAAALDWIWGFFFSIRAIALCL